MTRTASYRLIQLNHLKYPKPLAFVALYASSVVTQYLPFIYGLSSTHIIYGSVTCIRVPPVLIPVAFIK